MKKSNLLITLMMSALCALIPSQGRSQTIESMAPVVVKTVPESGTKEVSPGTIEIKVTFSKPMADGSWSWSTAWEGSTPEVVGKPKYEADGKTCVLKVKLEPGKTYAYWLNSGNFHNFKDRERHSAVPYLLVFQTKGS
jgi:Bacterial Ig-like domain